MKIKKTHQSSADSLSQPGLHIERCLGFYILYVWMNNERKHQPNKLLISRVILWIKTQIFVTHTQIIICSLNHFKNKLSLVSISSSAAALNQFHTFSYFTQFSLIAQALYYSSLFCSFERSAAAAPPTADFLLLFTIENKTNTKTPSWSPNSSNHLQPNVKKGVIIYSISQTNMFGPGSSQDRTWAAGFSIIHESVF